jgi:hypothetical protein
VQGTHAEGEAAAGTSRVRHGHWRDGNLGLDGLSRADSQLGLRVGVVGRGDSWATV